MSTPPVITSVTFSQANYTPGATMTVTVGYTSGTVDVTQSFTGTATSGTGQVGQLSVAFVVEQPDPAIVTAEDSGGRQWSKASDDGATAVFTAAA